MAGRGLDSAARVLRRPTIDQERHRSCALDDHQEPPHRGETRRTDDPGRCSGVPSLLASDTKCRQKTESLFAKAFKSLLQQNLPIPDMVSCADCSRSGRLAPWGKHQYVLLAATVTQSLKR